MMARSVTGSFLGMTDSLTRWFRTEKNRLKGSLPRQTEVSQADGVESPSAGILPRVARECKGYISRN
jgi:hypothetical protein